MQKTKNPKIGLCTFLRLPKTNPLKKENPSRGQKINPGRTEVRTYVRDQNHRSRNMFQGPIIFETIVIF